MRKNPLVPLLFAPLAVGVVTPVVGAVEGRVLSPSGKPIEHAHVRVSEDGSSAFTDMSGRFVLGQTEPPVELIVAHPRFEPLAVRIESGDAPVEIILGLKQQIYEAIAVTANPGEENFSPVSVAISVLDPAGSVALPNTLAEFVANTPGVAENGQGGILQTYSVRGVARLRVMTLVSGMRIVGERRAGVSASFIDPLLMGSADVLRGPSSTFYGSGALGGVVQLFPREWQGWTVESGYDTRGDELRQAVGWGGDGWSFGLAHRFAGNAETPGGAELNSGFRQTSATLARSWSSGEFEYELLAIGASGSDIRKSNTDFPERATVYPEEGHGLLRFAVRSEEGWDLAAWVHPNDLETRVTRSDGRVDTVLNDAIDFGLSWQQRKQTSRNTVVRFGADHFGRRSVDARETNGAMIDLALVQTGFQQTLDDGEEDESGLFGAVEANVGRATLLFGGRLAHQRQKNAGASSSDEALTGFAGLVVPVNSSVELVANVGTGLRFPSLSERFFSGTTGRGLVTGNEALDPERSLNIDVGMRWYGNRLFLAGFLFRNEIDDYIERIEIADGERTFVNLTSGTIEGVELEGFFQLAAEWALDFGGHRMQGRDDGGRPLADIPADSAFVGGRWSRGKWSWSGRLELRRTKDDPGSGEKRIPSATLVSSALAYEFKPGLELRLGARNLLDEEYFNAADSEVPPAAERSFSASISWEL